jgi:hypothetical protein
MKSRYLRVNLNKSLFVPLWRMTIKLKLNAKIRFERNQMRVSRFAAFSSALIPKPSRFAPHHTPSPVELSGI